MKAERWQVGEVTLTSVVEEQTEHIPPEFFFPEARAADVARHPWLVPDVEVARATRRRMLTRASERRALFLGTHFATRPAGRIEAHGDAFRFVPVP